MGQWDAFYNLADYKTGFGGAFGVQTDRVDNSALGWDHTEKLQQHESQKVDKTLNKRGEFDHDQGIVGTNYVKTKPDSKYNTVRQCLVSISPCYLIILSSRKKGLESKK